MTVLTIPIGSAVESGDGIPFRTAWDLTNQNFTNLDVRVTANLNAITNETSRATAAEQFNASGVAANAAAITAETARATTAEALLAPILNPSFAGIPTAPTAALGTNTNQLATMAAVTAAVSNVVVAGAQGVPNTRNIATSGALTGGGQLSADLNLSVALASSADVATGTDSVKVVTSAAVAPALALKAPLASPTFTGTPAAPTPVPGTSNTQLATTGFVTASFATLASPAFTGTPTAPTAALGTNTTQIATTAFALANGARTNITTAAFNDTRTLAILQAKLMGGVARLYSGLADGFAAQDGVDIANSTGVFVDTTGKQLIGGVGGPAFVIENTSSLPKMTSNTATATGATGYVVSASSQAPANGAYAAFNGSITDGLVWGSADYQPGAWLQIQLPAAIKLAGYALLGYPSNGNYGPSAWIFAGSNNGVNWTTLDTQTGVGNGSSRAVYPIAAANQGSYSFYRITISQTVGGLSGNYNPNITELELLQYTPAFESATSLPAMTSNTTTATGATGYTAFASSENGTSGAWKAMVAGAPSTANLWQSTSLAFPAFIGRGTPNPIQVGGYAFQGYYDGTNGQVPVNVQFQGSNDPTVATNPSAASWTTLDTRTTSGSSPTRYLYNVPQANQGLYKYHRLVINSYATTTSYNALDMMEFSLLQVLTGIEGQTSIPYMTGANTVVGGASGYAVTASSFQTSFEPYRASDGARPVGYTAGNDWLANATGAGWWQRQFPAALKILAYRVASMSGYSPLAWQLQGSNDGVNFTTIDSRTVGSNFWPSSYGDWSYFSVAAPGSYLYYRVNITTPTTVDSYPRIGEIEFLQGTSGNMDLRSVSAALGFTPTKASIFIPYKVNAGSVTLNTNLVASLSRDGTTWTPVTLTQGSAWNGFQTVMADGVDLSGTNTGTALKYRLQTTDGALGLTFGGIDLRSN
jgi:hypothetical protein